MVQSPTINAWAHSVGKLWMPGVEGIGPYSSKETPSTMTVARELESSSSKAPVQRFADRFTAYYIPVVVAVAILTYLIGGSATAAVATVLVACSCAIAMATPVTVLAAVGGRPGRASSSRGGTAWRRSPRSTSSSWTKRAR